MAFTYGINGLDEAKAYLDHPVLSARLIEISTALLTHKGKNIKDILGDIDALKLRSSITLFALISDDSSLFRQILINFYNNKFDRQTIGLIDRK